MEDPDRLADTIDPGSGLVRAVEALRIIEPSAGFERAIASLPLAAYKRRLRAIIGLVPGSMGDCTLEASCHIPDRATALFRDN